jgi:iron complex transport system substrate-binding protein
VKYRFLFFIIFSLGCLFTDCNNSESGRIKNSPAGSKIEPIEFAKGFSIQSNQGLKRITIYNPWQGAKNISFQYCLSVSRPDSSKLQMAMWIKKPVRRIICMSTTQIGMIEFAGELQTIVGISGAQYVCNQDLQKRIKDGQVKDIGYDINMNFELIYSLKPDLVLIYGVNSEASSLFDRLKSFGIPALFIGEYLEPNPLAKAEWVKLIACLFDKDSLVRDQYQRISNEYIRLQQMTAKISNRPLVMTGLPWKEAWNIAGGDSFTARLIEDAGGKYVWAERKTRDNIPMNLEQAVNDTKNADIWINSGIARSISDIKSTDERLGKLGPILKGKVFNNNKLICSGGGNDYWESGVVHPELILQDLIMIFHPELNLKKELTYYRKLE